MTDDYRTGPMRYDAAVEVRGKIVVPGDSQATTIPAGSTRLRLFAAR